MTDKTHLTFEKVIYHSEYDTMQVRCELDLVEVEVGNNYRVYMSHEDFDRLIEVVTVYRKVAAAGGQEVS